MESESQLHRGHRGAPSPAGMGLMQVGGSGKNWRPFPSKAGGVTGDRIFFYVVY